jgi:hypothetical protein
MKRGRLLSFKKRAVKVIDRTQEEILKDRLNKRNELLVNLRKKKECKE